MYAALLILLLTLSGYLVYKSFSRKKKSLIVAGMGLFLLTLLFFWFMGFWGEKLWFDSIGYPRRFWVVFITKVLYAAGGAIIGTLIVYLLTFSVRKESRAAGRLALLAGAVVGGAWGVINWDVILKFRNAVSTGLQEPILHRDAGFYLFELPFIDEVLTVLTLLSFIALLFSLFIYINGESVLKTGKVIFINRRELSPPKEFNSIFISAFVVLILLAAGKYVSRFHLMYSNWGVVSGPGWTDVHVRLPAYLVTCIATALTGVIIIIPSLRRKIVSRFNSDSSKEVQTTLVVASVTVLSFWFVALSALPGLFQWLRVEPNEISYEKPYIANNIRFTKIGFGLNKAEEKEFPVSSEFSKALVDRNPITFHNIRLWDWRALEAVYRQFQEIRLYYEFSDVDIDRYTFNDEYRQVMVSAREMNITNLPSQSQTFVNKRFKYTHGNGITLTTVSEFTPDGLPNLLIKNIPPVSSYKELTVEQPGIYFGELNNTPVVANSKEAEFDYPKGEENVYIHYRGRGGVLLDSWWRKFLYGWKFDGTKFFLSTYITRDSRIMFDRNIIRRASKIAPFLKFDEDPYIVLDKGKLYWILDGYTTSSYFPYSEPYNATEKIEYKDEQQTKVITRSDARYLDGVNYVRNSVKVVIDAFEGSVDFYTFDEEDPVLKVWSRIFPNIFKSRSEMPEGLFRHVRYPSDLLLTQGMVYSKYHMSDPEVFYNQEDLWVRATEKYYGGVQPVEPYYVMWQQPGREQPDFVLILPFTPKNKQVMIGWIAGMCDGINYGRFLAYLFPKEKRILGPQQVETKIDQDRFLSSQLALWDQRGSRVIRGNVLAIPIDNTMIYVEPIYLQAETAAYPELRLVVIMHGDKLSYGETFDKALAGIYGEAPAPVAEEKGLPVIGQKPDFMSAAKKAFEDYLRYTGDGNFSEASRALERLKEILNNAEKNK